MSIKSKNIIGHKQYFFDLLLFCLLVVFTNIAVKAQQDPQFSQNQLNQLTINPGYAGSTGLINLSLLNRYQWVGMPGAPVTLVFNTDGSAHLIGKNDGIGLSIISDDIGFEKNISVGLNYSWRKNIGNGSLGSGISFAFMNKSFKLDMTGIDGSDLLNLSDPALPKGEVSGVLTDIGAGLYYKTKDYYLALSVKHINQATLSFDESGKYSLRRHYYLNGGYSFQMSDERMVLIPSIYLKSDATTFQADFNITLMYDKRFWGGLGYRPEDAIVISIGSELRNGIKFGYSYDISTSALSRYNSGSHEIFLAYSLLLNKKRTHAYKSVRFL